jgi:predicted RNA binding protein YcfA (HicA-like mRNA interferase family)
MSPSAITTVISLKLGEIVAKEIIRMLEGKTFDIVSSHSGFKSGQNTRERVSLKSSEPVISGTLIKILLSPSRSISFDVTERPVIFFESPRQIRIERRLPSSHKLVRTILINDC